MLLVYQNHLPPSTNALTTQTSAITSKMAIAYSNPRVTMDGWLGGETGEEDSEVTSEGS